MASAADAVAYAAQGGWDQATVMQVAYWLQSGEEPGGLTGQARAAIDAIGGMGLSSTGVSQLVSYLQTGQAPADLSYVDESAQVLGTPDVSAAVPSAAPTAGVVQAPTSPAGSTEVQKSARALIQSTLNEYGLGSLGDRLWQQYLSGSPIEQIFNDMRATPEYKTRFPYMEELAKKGRAITEAEAISTERALAQVARQAGLPSGFYDSPDDFSKLIGGEVSPAEWAKRVQLASDAINGDPTIQHELGRFAGVFTPGELTAFWLDPDKALPALEQKFEAAKASSTAIRTGFGALSIDEANRLAQLGISDEQLTGGFSTLAGSSELVSALPGSGEEAIGRNDQLAAVFERNAQAIAKLNRRARSRTAVFEGGGSFTSSKTGLSGVGAAGS